MTGLATRKIPNLVIAGENVPQVLQSWRFWRDVFSGVIPEYAEIQRRFRQNGYVFPGSRYDFQEAARVVYRLTTDTTCPFCGSSGTRYDDHGYYFCICYMLQLYSEMLVEAAALGSPYQQCSIDSLIGTSLSSKDPVDTLKTAMGNWIDNPNISIVLQGNTGTGKTHCLQAAVTAWYPFVLYLVASDFEKLMRDGLSRDRENPGTLSRICNSLINWPGLAFDDLGLEYASPWIAAKMEDLFENRLRSNVAPDRVTLVATNIRRANIHLHFVRDGVSRIGSRLKDRSMVVWSDWLEFDFREVKKRP